MRYQRRETVTAGTSKVIILPKELDSLPISIQLAPGSGGTLAITASCDDITLLEQNPSLASWTDLSPASVTSSTIISVAIPIGAIKVTATAADGVVNLMTYKVPYMV